jgi:exodeoxyribonuclease VII large subunit
MLLVQLFGRRGKKGTDSMETVSVKYVSVTDVVRRIKDDLQGDYRLQNIAMEGNIIGLKKASTGHYYMNLRDDTCSIHAILFRSRAGRSMDHVKEGDHVVVIGAVNVYEKGGSVSFIIERLFSQGTGSLQAQYERMKARLEQQGYFDSDHKQDLPRFPWTVGVLTSRTGAVIHDIYKIAAERNPYIEIRLFPIPVQGEGAAAPIAAALQKAGRDTSLDVLILARGGGSMEDLWCFNSPEVVQAIYHATVPVITAIGHETDTSLADYAADVRAATPTHAAELAFPDVQDIEMNLAAMLEDAYSAVIRQIQDKKTATAHMAARLQPQRYQEFLAMKQQQVAQLVTAASKNMELLLAARTGMVSKTQASLQAMDPAALVRKGYGQLMQGNHIVSDIHTVTTAEPLCIQLVEGAITTDVKEVTIYGKNNR